MEQSKMARVKLGTQGFEVSKIGFGCMGLAGVYNTPVPEDAGVAIIRHAFEADVTFFDTANVYGPHTSEVLLGKALSKLPREKVQVSTKCGLAFNASGICVNGHPDYVRACCEASLELFFLHRIDQSVPIEETLPFSSREGAGEVAGGDDGGEPSATMNDVPHRRERDEDPPNYDDDSGKFTVVIEHNGFFCGLIDHLEYVTGTEDVWDNCHVDTFSLHWIHEFINVGGNDVTEKTSVYWCLPGKTHRDGLCLIENDSHINSMMAALSSEVKYLCLMVDHTEFLKYARKQCIIPIPSQYTGIAAEKEAEKEAGHSSHAAEQEVSHNSQAAEKEESEISYAITRRSGKEIDSQYYEDMEGSDSDSNSEFYDSDFDAYEGDDDLFLDNVDLDVNDNNEQTEIVEEEDDAGLDHDALDLTMEQVKQLKYNFKEFNPEVDMEAPVFKVGMVFSSMSEFRKALNAYAVNERVKIRKPRNEATRIHAVCEEGCPWMIKASQQNRKEAIVVREFCDDHKCERLWELESLTAPFLTSIFIDEFRDNQKLDLTAFAAKVERKFNMCPNRFKLGRARKAALTIIHGDESEQFSLLCDYGQELRRSNPGSRFFLSTNEVQDATGPKEHLATLYFSYDACKRGFLEGYRPIICIDGCHIKTKYKGNLLTAVGIDGNDCIYPIAMGLVEVECTSSWEWFLTTLRDDLNITNTSPYTIMSDKQKGLINAVQKVWPDAEHRFCVRHLYQNFHKKHKGETLKNDLWAIARSTNIPTWTRNMEKLKVDSEEAWKWVEELQPNTFVKAFFSDFPKCDMLLNNHCEVFNSYILQAREMPILSMLETIFYKLMHRNVGKQKECEKWHGTVCPKIKKKVDKATELAKTLSASYAGKGLFHVKSHDFQKIYNVDMAGRSCDCNRWQLTGIPCHHAIACCRVDRRDPCSLVHSCYSIETYKRAYAYNLVPLRSRVAWEKMNAVRVYPPLYTKVMGRPKKNRRKTPEEIEKNGVKILTREGMVMHCSICKNPNHNKKGHAKWVLEQNNRAANVDVEHEDYDDPTILQHIMPLRPDPRRDPMHQPNSMVYRIGQEQRAHFPLTRNPGPLPEESSFVVAARDALPTASTRVTTASRGRGAGEASRGRGAGGAARGRGASGAARGRGATGSSRGREASGAARGRGASGSSRGRGPGGAAEASSSQPTRGKGKGTKRKASTARPSIDAPDYNTAPGSAYHLLFGDDQVRASQSAIPDLNELIHEDTEEEIQITQNAPE